MAVDPVVDLQQVVLLDLGDVGRDLGDPAHRLVVKTFVFVVLRGEDLQRYRQGEAVGPAPLAEINDPLPART